MIKEITQKEYKKVRWTQKHGTAPKSGYAHMFKAVNGKYYRSDLLGMPAAKEQVEFNKALKQQAAAQIKLL